ncbi:1-aminocyclopropane-1-carboxylate oxidase homolog 1-like protein [Tanacetum coccineum]
MAPSPPPAKELLKLKPNHLGDRDCDKRLSFAAHYAPACPHRDLTSMGSPNTTYAGFLNVLLQDDIGGLQMLHQDRWIDVPQNNDALVINLISNDKLKSVAHKVMENEKGLRVSVASFLRTFISLMVHRPTKELVLDDNPPRYRETIVHDYIPFLSMANVPEVIIDGSVAQLTRAVASGSIPWGLVNRVVSKDVVESFRRDLGGDVVSGNVSDSVSLGVGSHVMVNGFAESRMGNGVNELVFQGIAHGMVSGVRARSVDGIGAGNVSESGILNSGIRVNSVNESIVVNDVRTNGSVRVTGGFGSSLGQAVRVRNVSELVSQGMVNVVGASSVTETVMVDTVRDNDVSGVRINGVNESVIVNDVRAMSNDVRTNSGVGVTGASSVSETVMVDSVRGNDAIGVRINGVNESVMVNDVRFNGVGGSVSRALVDHTGQLDKDHLLGWFNQEVVEDLGRLREYRSVARGLKAVVRRRRERIRRLELLRNCQDVAATIRFWERMQLEGVEKGTRALLMMKETEVKIGEKARFILNLRRRVVE